MDNRSEEERRRDKEKERLERYRYTNPNEYERLVQLQRTNPAEFEKLKLQITNPELYRVRYPEGQKPYDALERYQASNPNEYAKLMQLQSTNPTEFEKLKLQITNPEMYRARYSDDALEKEKRRKYDLSGIPTDLGEDKAKAIGLKTEIENHILEKLSDYIISKHPRGNYTTTTYQIAIVNVLKNIFKDPNSDIINYIETKLKEEPEKKGTLGFFGLGGKTKRKRRNRRKTRRR
jgi:hypothetical protein